MRSWDPDVAIDCAIAHRVVSAQFREFAGQAATYLGRGWDNFCVEYPNGIVFRLPTRKLGAEILRHETLALPVVIASVTAPQIPRFLYLGQPSDAYPYPFVGYAKIPGQTADGLNWQSTDRREAAEVLGCFLADLHAIDPEQPALRDLPADEPAKREPRLILQKLRTRLEIIETHFRPATPTITRAVTIAEQAAEQPLAPYERRLIHGDLYPRRVLAQQGPDGLRTTGIIDWGDIQIGDPAIDLSIACTFFDAAERPAFWAAYGRPESEFNCPVMIARAAMYGFALLAYSLQEDDHACAKMGRQILDRLPSRRMI